MGWCHEFGSQIREGCGHPMTAGDSTCACTTCGVVCAGKFSACSAVWERGPRELTLASPAVVRRPGAVFPRPGTGGSAKPVVASEPAPVAAPADDGRGEVLEWLQSAFEGVRGDLARVMEAVALQQKALAALTDAEGVTAQLAELAEVLPDRVCAAVAEAIAATADADSSRRSAMNGDAATTDEMSDEMRQILPDYIDQAVREIVRPGQGAMMNRVDEVAAQLRESLVEVQASAVELRNEMARLAAFRSALAADQPELAHAVAAATERADGRLTTLGQRMDALAERPEWQAVRSHLPFRRD